MGVPARRPSTTAARTWKLKRGGRRHEEHDGIRVVATPTPAASGGTTPGCTRTLTFCVQPDPISGMQCWHQRVRVTPAEAGDEYGDVVVDTAKSREAYLEWMEKTRPAGTTKTRVCVARSGTHAR